LQEQEQKHSQTRTSHRAAISKINK
jgi:hypothetical protein